MIVVVGCGNLNRSDDGVGPCVIKALRDRSTPSEAVRFLDAGTDGMATMFAARGCRTLIIADAARSGSEPGAVFEIPGEELERHYEPGLNLHDFRWDHALHAGRKIFREAFPRDVTVLLVEAGSVGFGIGLSAPVAAAVEHVVDRVQALIIARLAAATTG